MKYNSDIHHRRSIRLKGYDYLQAGLYFITICTQNRLHFFGEIQNGEMVLNDAGMMINTVWDEIPIYYNGFNLHEFVVMPNHVHGIIQIIPNPVGATTGAGGVGGLSHVSVAPLSLSDIVHRFKTLTTKQYTDGVKNNNWPRFNKKLWQRNYYEHIIRDEKAYHQISEYIQTNPLTWQDDKYYV